MTTKKCLVCDGDAVVGIVACTADEVDLCALHLADYADNPGGAVAQELDKFFADGGELARDRYLRRSVVLIGGGVRTDETPGQYNTHRTDER